tara:strand:+ start:222 stop:452 length:231 start_codon:yes stop_codon:yes gene_type:complete
METLSEEEQAALVYGMHVTPAKVEQLQARGHDDAHRNATALQHTKGDVEAAMALLCKGRTRCQKPTRSRTCAHIFT